MTKDSVVFQRHQRLAERYQGDPQQAMITDMAEIRGSNLDDPFRSEVTINDELQVPFRVGVHRAVGGDHDFPNPGDILCAALASCFETTLRMIANRLQIELEATQVKATALVDVRGTLMLNTTVPVNFQSMNLEVKVKGKAINDKVMNTLVKGAKHCCIVYQTIRKGIPVNVDIEIL